MKLRYFQISFSYRTEPPNKLRSNGGESKFPCDFEKWKTSDFPCSMAKPNKLKREVMIL